MKDLVIVEDLMTKRDISKTCRSGLIFEHEFRRNQLNEKTDRQFSSITRTPSSMVPIIVGGLTDKAAVPLISASLQLATPFTRSQVRQPKTVKMIEIRIMGETVKK